MFKKGISVFNGLKEYSMKENIEYLKKAKELGYEIVFSSFHINEANNSFNDVLLLNEEIKKLGMKLSLDISKDVFENIPNLSSIYSLRLDFGFSDEEIIDLSNKCNYYLELNASVINEERFIKLVEKGLNVSKIRASFNYYPKLHTAHNICFCDERTSFFHKYNISVGAFIPSSFGKRAPLYEGLPTVESHRNCNLSLAIEELKACGVDEIIFGDAYASIEELRILDNHWCNELMIECDFFKDLEVKDIIFNRRIDSNDELLRLKKISFDGVPFNQTKRSIFDLTIDNSLFLRYCGEVNIVLKELESDLRVNVIGHLDLSSFLLEKISKGVSFKIVKKSV